MNNSGVSLQGQRRPASQRFLILLLYVVAGLPIGNFIGFLVGLFFTGFDMDLLVEILQNPYHIDGSKTIMLVVQGVIALVAFLVVPILFGMRWDKKQYDKVTSISPIGLELGLLVVLFMMATMPFNAALLEWLSVENWPEALSELGEWVASFDGNYDQLTAFFVDFQSSGEFILAVFVMALLPAVGEEFLFRGFLQPIFIEWTGKVHLGIILTAIIFSAFHMQIAAFLPRFLLGLAMGYFFYWTGNLAYSMLAHFVNNFVTLLLAGMYKLGWTNLDVSNDTEVPVIYIISSLIVMSVLLYRINQQKPKLEND